MQSRAYEPGAPSRLRLRTLGTLSLTGPAGEAILVEQGQQGLRLALLALLAAAGTQGRTRDQLLGFFWPEATPPRARHSLTQLLYAIRSTVHESIIAGTNPLRLNEDAIECDVAMFERRLDAGEHLAAVDLYGGPFLDGFYLSGAPEFERWVNDERARLQSRYAGALERLAGDAESGGDRERAIALWRRLSDLDPLSGRYAVGLMNALAAAGDHAAALAFAERYEVRVAEEIGSGVGSAVATVVAELRARSGDRVKAARRLPDQAAQSRDAGLPAPPDASPPARLLVPSGGAPPGPPRMPLRAAALFAAVLVVALVGFLVTRRDPATVPPTTMDPSIAVLPLRNLSVDVRDLPLADAMTEELIGVLSNVDRLRVIASSSTFMFRNGELGVRRIADSLGVAYVVEGGFQKVGDRVHVQLRLIDVRSGSTLWGQAYDRTLRDIFEVQRDIAASVARELDLRLVAGAEARVRRGPTQNIAAYELYLRGRDPVLLRTDSGPARGLALLQEATRLDSTFAAAWANMPYMYFGLSGRARTREGMLQYRRLAESAARRALALDSTLPEAHVGLGVALVLGAPDLHGSEAALRHALALGSPPRVREHLSRVLMWSGRYAEALGEATRAVQEDPLSASARADLGEVLCANGRPTEGQAQLERLAALEPPLQRVRLYLALCFAVQGRWEAVIGELRDAADPRGPILLGYALGRAGDTAGARRFHDESAAQWQHTGRGALRVAGVAAGLGALDEAFAWLERSTDDAPSAGVMLYPIFHDLQADARFGLFLRRRGLMAP